VKTGSDGMLKEKRLSHFGLSNDCQQHQGINFHASWSASGTLMAVLAASGLAPFQPCKMPSRQGTRDVSAN
jgi:hypothetical protein